VLPSAAEPEALPQASSASDGDARLIARDERKNPLFSSLDWTAEAVERIFRVPVGYMRKRTQDRVDALARERGVGSVDLELVEAAIEHGRRLMEDLMGGTQPAATAAEASTVRARPAERSKGFVGEGYLNEVSLLTAKPRRARVDEE